MELRLVYITAKDKDEAKQIGRALVEEQLAACINVLDGMESVYRWKGKIEEGSEAVLIAKTTAANVPTLTARVKELSSYECPCVVSLLIDGGNEEYLRWLQEGVL